VDLERKQISQRTDSNRGINERISEVTPYVCCLLWHWRDWSNCPTLAVLNVPSQIVRNALCLRPRCLCQKCCCCAGAWKARSRSSVPAHLRRPLRLPRGRVRCPWLPSPLTDSCDVTRCCPCSEFCASSCCSSSRKTRTHPLKMQLSQACDSHPPRQLQASQRVACCTGS
jgi:hypothetical protein